MADYYQIASRVYFAEGSCRNHPANRDSNTSRESLPSGGVRGGRGKRVNSNPMKVGRDLLKQFNRSDRVAGDRF